MIWGSKGSQERSRTKKLPLWASLAYLCWGPGGDRVKHASQTPGMRGLGPHLSATCALWSSPKTLIESSFRSRGQCPGRRAGALTGQLHQVFGQLGRWPCHLPRHRNYALDKCGTLDNKLYLDQGSANYVLTLIRRFLWSEDTGSKVLINRSLSFPSLHLPLALNAAVRQRCCSLRTFIFLGPLLTGTRSVLISSSSEGGSDWLILGQTLPSSNHW